MGLLDNLGRLVGRVEVALAGAEGHLADGEAALERRDAMRARAAAHALLARVPGSPLGLALLADACEMAGLEAELLLTLEELSERAPSRADVWVRLGNARARQEAGADDGASAPDRPSGGEAGRDAFMRALAVAELGSEARREALLCLADLDLAQGDGARAELWLERIVGPKDREVALRRAEARLLLRDPAGAAKNTDALGEDPTDGRTALLRGRIACALGHKEAFSPLLRAYVLEVPWSSEALSHALSVLPVEKDALARVRAVVESRGEARSARFRAAFARAEGRPDEARLALRDAVMAGDVSAARPLFEAAVDDEDAAAMMVALGALRADGDPLVADARRLPSVVSLAIPEDTERNLDALLSVTSTRLGKWSAHMRDVALRYWIPEAPLLAVWPDLLRRLDQHARTLGDLDTLGRVAELTRERERPVRVAIVGEFNAGKSTFINALIGADVAPTGVLPTTATLHHLRYAQDPLARILFFPDADGTRKDDRLLPLPELRTTLRSLDPGQISRVELLVPLASLTRVEILDTPGFNAPDPRHTKAARSAFDEADAVIWLLDAGQALKQSEKQILDEARAAKVPVQILVNKADRLDDAELARVLATVDEGLAEAGIRSWSPVVALSARLALQGKLGDADALARSRWADVQALMDTQIIGRSDDLKERALRRRAVKMAADLRRAASGRAHAEEEAHVAARTAAQEAGVLAAKLDRELEESAQVLVGALGPALGVLAKDLEVTSFGRDREAALKDPVVVRYRTERATNRLAEPMAHVLARMAAGGSEARKGAEARDLVPLCRALVRGFWLAGAEDATALSRAAITTLIERLATLSWSVPAREGMTSLEGELVAIEGLLGRG